MSTQSNIRDWFLQCPDISEIASFNVDYIGSEPIECTIYSSPSTLNYIEDVTGNISYAKRQTLNFVFAVQFPFGDDALRNLVNLVFFEKIQTWMYAQNKAKNFPEIEEGEVVSIMPTQTPYLTHATTNSAVYELSCSMSYEMSESD